MAGLARTRSSSRAFPRLGHVATIAMLALIVLATGTVSAAPQQQTVVDICSRTAEVQTAILAEVSGAACSTVTDTQLAGITYLAITGYSSASIVSSDFAGLTGLPRLDITDSPDLTTVPANAFSEVTGALTDLRLPRNRIATVHAEAFNGLTALEVLDLNANAITSLDADIFDGLTNLTSLTLNANGITTLDADIFDGLTALEVLDLSFNNFNPITSLDADIFDGLTNLTILSLSDNGSWTPDPNIFDGLTALERLDLSSNGITTLDADIFDGLTALEVLELSGNAIETLDADIFDGLTNLTNLTLNANDITTLDADIFDGLTGLKVLDLFGNEIETLDADIFDGLTALERLYFFHNAIETLDADIFDGLTNLVFLSFRSNAIETLDADIFDGLTNLKTLNFGNNAIETLDADIFDGLTNLERLSFGNNAIETLDADIFDGLTNLTSLSFGNSAIETLDADIFDGLSALEFLYVRDNRVSVLPVDLFDPLDDSLVELWLSDNSLTDLPDGIFDGLTGLQTLNLSCNSLTVLDLDRFDPFATTLTTLDIRGNRFTTPPTETDLRAKLTNLTTLLTGDKLCRVNPDTGAPTFADARTARSVAENTTAGRPIGAPVAAVDPDGDRLTYTLGGTDAASFDIVETSGQLRTKTALNHEGRSSYSVTVSVHDGKDANGDVDTATDDTIDVTIDVGNVDEAGTVSFAQIGDAVTATVSDPDGSVHSEVWQWARSSRRSRGWTDIMSATSASYTPVDDDQGMYLRATASYDDAHGPGKGAQGVSASQIALPDLRVTTLVSGLSIPWDIAFTPDGTMLFTQRAGVLSSRLTDGTVQTITADLSDLFASGETGLMGIVVDPRFSSNRRFYTCQGHTGPEVQVIAWTINADYTAATRVADPLVGGMPASSGRHGGCRLRFGPNGYLWISTGDAATGTAPQDLTSLSGKVLRVNASTGAGAPANPFASSPLIYTYGHRNVQGLARRPRTSQMWSVEHGPSVDDEINLLIAGGNYGWDPVPGYNQNVPMTDLAKFPGAVEAKWSSGSPTLASSGAVFLEGRQWGVWEGRLAVATLRDSKLRLFEFTADGAFVSQVILPELDGTFGRLRTPMLGPDGALYVTTSNGGGADRILRVGENRAPAFASASAVRSVAENTMAGRNIGAPVVAVDPDEDALVYTLGGTDAASFDIVESSGLLLTKAALDYETRSSYRVTVTAADTSGVSDEITVTITVENVNEAPAFAASETSARIAPENTAAGRNIGDPVAATDPDRGDTLTYTLDGADAAVFDIVEHSGQLRTKDSIDYEVRATYFVTVSVRDSRDASGAADTAPDDTITVTIDVEDVNEPPMLSGPASVDHEENGSVSVATYTATDPEKARLAWSLSGNDSGDFTIDNGTLRFCASPDYEHPADANRNNEYRVTVRISDGINVDTLDVLVTIDNVDEPGMITLSSRQPQVGTALTATLTDPDGNVRSITWSWQRSPGFSDPVTPITGVTAASYTPVDADLGSHLWVSAVDYTDGEGSGKGVPGPGTLAVQAAPPTNEPPAFPPTETGARTIDENTGSGVNIGDPVSATDPDIGDTLTYTLSGTDAASFDIVASSGQLQTKATLDHETKSRYRVTVTVTDTSAAFDTINVTITVDDVNEAPAFPSTELGTRTVAESSSAGVNIGAPVRARDPDSGDTLTYTLSGTDAASFDIVATSGQMQTRAAPGLRDRVQLYRCRVGPRWQGCHRCRRHVDGRYHHHDHRCRRSPAPAPPSSTSPTTIDGRRWWRRGGAGAPLGTGRRHSPKARRPHAQ